MRDDLANLALLAISPLDGRYHAKTAALQDIFSEKALISQRIWVECSWLRILACSNLPQLPNSKELIKFLAEVRHNDIESAIAVKNIESETNHDVKAVEYWLRSELEKSGCADWIPFIHFGCTSEDINNLAYGRMLSDAIQKTFIPELNCCLQTLNQLISETKSMPMLARTHGQTASPTTMGKELCNFAERIIRARDRLKNCKITGKFNGAVGNFNAPQIALPSVDWLKLSKQMIEQCGLVENRYTTQIEPHDGLACIMQNIANINTILIDLSRDIWTYISLGYFQQTVKDSEVGSSTMPHKVNPIDFENAEGNLGLANAIALHLAGKLPISRLQRDLTDSTVLRNLGSVFAYCSIAQQSLQKGLKKLNADAEKMLTDLDNSWEVLAEAIQTCMRANGDKNAYETLKKLTRGKTIDKKTITNIIDSCDFDNDTKDRLKNLSPQDYIGYAITLTNTWLENNREQ